MIIREATIADIPDIQIVRNAVTENTLSDPSLVTDEDCAIYLTMRGKGWVAEQDGAILGFAIADLLEYNIWALFVHPAYEQQGLGKQLHDIMLDWYFSQTKHTVWLSTTPNTRAATFYQKKGWTQTGLYGKNELKFEMRYEDWTRYKE